MESKRKVQTEEAQQYALESDIIYMETSAKSSLNVRNLFVEIGNYAFVIRLYTFSILLFSLLTQQKNFQKPSYLTKVKRFRLYQKKKIKKAAVETCISKAF